MRLFTLTLLILASPLFACCPKDTDTLAEEVGDDPSVLDVIAGQVPRYPPEWHAAKLETARGPIERAPWLDQLNRQDEALDELAGEFSEDELGKVRELRVRLALHLWWRGGAGAYTPRRCLEIVRESHENLPARGFLDRMTTWMELNERADPDRIHADMFNLRQMPNKKSAVSTGQLANAGLQGLEARLIELIRLHPVWENFDTFHALSLAYAVEGKQNLAQFARFRAWELHAAGEYSRVPGSDTLEDIQAATLVRERIGRVYRPVQLVTDEHLSHIEAQFKARRQYATAWRKAVAEHARGRLEGGLPLAEVAEWDDFVPPESRVPPLSPPTSNASPMEDDSGSVVTPGQSEARASDISESGAVEETSRRSTWIMLGVLVGIMLAGLFAKSRIDRSARALVEQSEAQEETS